MKGFGNSPLYNTSIIFNFYNCYIVYHITEVGFEPTFLNYEPNKFPVILSRIILSRKGHKPLIPLNNNIALYPEPWTLLYTLWTLFSILWTLLCILWTMNTALDTLNNEHCFPYSEHRLVYYKLWMFHLVLWTFIDYFLRDVVYLHVFIYTFVLLWRFSF